MIRLSLPGMVMNMAEFAVEEILTLVSAQFGTSQLAAQSALITIVTITYNAALGLSVAASTRTANWIGARATSAAKVSADMVSFNLNFSIPRHYSKEICTPAALLVLTDIFAVYCAGTSPIGIYGGSTDRATVPDLSPLH